MQTWTKEELDDFCEQAIEFLNTKKRLQLEFKECWVYSNSAGGNFHIIYRNNFLNKEFHLCRNSRILQDSPLGIDMEAGLEKVEDLKLKIVLRIAFHIFRDCKREMREEN